MRNETTLNALVQELQSNCGDELAACKAVGVSLLFVNQWRKDDKKVDEVLREAAHVGTQGLVSEAIRRAVHGYEKDVFYKGVRVGASTEYSDSLLAKLLEAKRDEFKKGSDGGVQVNVNVANVMPRASSYQEWLAMKDKTLNRALPAPDDADVIDVECVPVETESVFKGIEL
jgi:hypothetical protein